MRSLFTSHTSKNLRNESKFIERWLSGWSAMMSMADRLIAWLLAYLVSWSVGQLNFDWVTPLPGLW